MRTYPEVLEQGRMPQGKFDHVPNFSDDLINPADVLKGDIWDIPSTIFLRSYILRSYRNGNG